MCPADEGASPPTEQNVLQAPEKADVDGQTEAAATPAEEVGGSQPAGAQPVLPWMQVPIEVETSGGVPVGAVRGLNPSLRAALTKGTTHA